MQKNIINKEYHLSFQNDSSYRPVIQELLCRPISKSMRVQWNPRQI
jgi:hypothetical protein